MTAGSATDPHASRLAAEQIAERADPVLWGEGDGPCPDDVLRAFGRRGFHPGKGLAADEAAGLLAEAERLARRADRARPEVVTEPDSDAVRSIFRVHASSEPFRALCRDPRLVEVARQIVGSDVYVHQSRLNYKPGFDGREFFWHSDFETWHVEDGMPRMRAVSVSVALTPNDVANGPLLVIPGSHLRYVRCAGDTPRNHYKRSLQRQEIGVPSREAIREFVEEGGIHACVGPAGSTVFFDCNILHGSSSSLSPVPRTNLFVVYNSVENTLVEPFGGRPARPSFLGERTPPVRGQSPPAS